MDEKGMRNGWNNNPKILEDVFEALVGAIYLDLGLAHAKQFILRIYENPEFIDLQSIMIDDNYKDHLMRYCQTNGLTLPDYRVTSHENGIFVIDVLLTMYSLDVGVQRVRNKLNNTPLSRIFTHQPI